MLSGRYQLLERLGRGAMAEVFRARDTRMGVDRAVKILRPPRSSREELSRRLHAEARVMAKLGHPNIVAVHDIGSEGPFDYVVMDVADHGTLAQRLADRGPLLPSQAIRWMVDVLAALAVAHARGIVHRDVKPSNILLDAHERPLLADFGVALVSDFRSTGTGIALGSVAFMPPEQRLDASSVDHRADIYAVGATLFRLVTCENPIDLFLANEHSSRWDPVDQRLAEVLRWATAQDPADRPTSAGELATCLEELHLSPGWAAPPRVFPAPADPRPTLLPPTESGRRYVVPALASFVVVGLVTMAAGWLALGTVMPPVAAGEDAATKAPTSEPGPSSSATPAPAPPSAGQAEEPLTPPSTSPTRQAPALVAPSAGSPDAPSPAAAATPTRAWRMSRNGVGIVLRLTGETGVTGTMTSSLGGKESQEPVRGTFDPETRRLQLVETATGARYDIVMDEDSGRGQGTVEVNGTLRTLTLRQVEGAPL